MAKSPSTTKNPYKTMYRGVSTSKKADGMHRPEGAGNFDLMDDHGVASTISLAEGTIQHTPVNAKDIANKAYVDGIESGLWKNDGNRIVPISGANIISGAGMILGGALSGAALKIFGTEIDDFSNEIDADHIHVEVRNESGSTMNKGDAVFISGFNVGLGIPLVDFADASAESTMPAVGLINETLANNVSGEMHILGTVEDFDTSAFSAGDEVFVSTTGTTGNTLTSTKPTAATDIVQEVGIVLRSNASSGVVQLNGGHEADIPNTIDIKGSISGSSLLVSGDISGATLHGDGSALTGISGSDDLGNHIATQTISGSDIDFTGDITGDGSSLTGTISAASVANKLSGASVLASQVVHSDDSSDPHGATLTQTKMSGTDISSTNMQVIGDHTVSGTAYVQNAVYTEGDEPTPSTYPIGTLLIKYTA